MPSHFAPPTPFGIVQYFDLSTTGIDHSGLSGDSERHLALGLSGDTPNENYHLVQNVFATTYAVTLTQNKTALSAACCT